MNEKLKFEENLRENYEIIILFYIITSTFYQKFSYRYFSSYFLLLTYRYCFFKDFPAVRPVFGPRKNLNVNLIRIEIRSVFR
jgi:hypothetical protein